MIKKDRSFPYNLQQHCHHQGNSVHSCFLSTTKNTSQVINSSSMTESSLVQCLTFLLLYLESLLGLRVQVLQVLRPAAFDKNILLVVLRCCVVHGQPLLVLSPLQSSCSGESIGENERPTQMSILSYLVPFFHCQSLLMLNSAKVHVTTQQMFLCHLSALRPSSTPSPGMPVIYSVHL